jgi:hypothetical protein
MTYRIDQRVVAMSDGNKMHTIYVSLNIVVATTKTNRKEIDKVHLTIRF